MNSKIYIRDKRSPKPKNENVSRVMSANKAKNSRPELQLRKALWESGSRGYRLHYKKIPGKPDICFVSKKLAIFMNGCFWHRCPYCDYALPKTNKKFWVEKFKRNVIRDKNKTAILKKMGWRVTIVWECKIKDDVDKIAGNIQKMLS